MGDDGFSPISLSFYDALGTMELGRVKWESHCQERAIGLVYPFHAAKHDVELWWGEV